MDFKIARQGGSVIVKIIKFTILSQKHLIFRPKTGRGLRFYGRTCKSFRLMVGVPDYENYLAHMKQHHPDLTPMDAKTFYRHCIDARYPSAGGNMKKCPC
ncbi:MAG: YbdD/YjiX family protein [Acinetobacter sp.]